ncbi:MAG: branched-chain amino acid ABC transporter substrate-binding protein [Desulfovibrio sp.]
MKKLFKLTLLAVMAVAMMAGAAECKTLKIGSMSPLTGPWAADGQDIANGVQCAVAVMMDNGGVAGFDNIEVISEDTAGDPRQAVAAANKLINEEVTAVVGSYASSCTLPSSEVLDEEDILMITPASTAESVTERGLPYMFRTCGRNDDQGKAALAFMQNVLKAKTIYIVDDKTTYSQGLADNMRALCEANGIEVIAHEHVNQGDKDYSAVLTKVAAAKPDVFYVSLQNSATGALMAIQAHSKNVTANILGQDAVYHPQLIEIGKAAAEGMYLTFGYSDKETEAYKKYYAKYKTMFGEPGAYTAYAYDSAMAYMKAVAKAGTTEPAAVKAALLDLDFQGASKMIDYKANGDSGSNYIIQKVEGGKFVNYYNPETGSLF